MVSKRYFDSFNEESLSIKLGYTYYDEIMSGRHALNTPQLPLSKRRSPPKETSRNWGEHALWVGNIASEATVMSLRDYFSKAAPYHVLSVAYNPDAKYAFVNFASDSSRAAAITHAATNMFEGKRLDCRIRQGAMSRSTKIHYGMSYPGRASFTVSPQQGNSVEQQAQELLHFPEVLKAEWGGDKYFILKSFSLEALSRSIETGQWYIPKRHCTRLNIAFKSARRVYFVFSVNGSGSFAGVALMKSETRQESARPTHHNDIHRTASTGSEGSIRPSSTSDPSSPEAGRRIPTIESDSFAAGTICYEPERRRIVWEAAQDLDQNSEDDDSSSFSSSPTRSFARSPWSTSSDSKDPFGRTWSDTPLTPHSLPFQSASIKALWNAEEMPGPSNEALLLSRLEQFGNPCQIKWLSTKEIPFEEVRGIKNAWNSNKEVHVARNVTAIETNAASYLLQSWNISPADAAD